MPHKPIPYKVWVKCLLSFGLTRYNHLGKGDHEVWNFPEGQKQLNRPVVFREGSK